jgi:hypothetical protein
MVKLRRRHTGLEFNVCGRYKTCSNHRQVLVIDADIQRMCVPLSSGQDKAQEALHASHCAPGVGRDILDVQLSVNEVGLWNGVECLLDV